MPYRMVGGLSCALVLTLTHFQLEAFSFLLRSASESCLTDTQSMEPTNELNDIPMKQTHPMSFGDLTGHPVFLDSLALGFGMVDSSTSYTSCGFALGHVSLICPYPSIGSAPDLPRFSCYRSKLCGSVAAALISSVPPFPPLLRVLFRRPACRRPSRSLVRASPC